MADELGELRARVTAARDQLTSDVDFVQKVELRLNDLARIVEGSLARQGSELEAARVRITTLDTDLARALARAEQSAGDASRADHLAKENGELRSMVMTLLEVIEGRQKSSVADVMQQLEENVAALVTPDASAAATPEPEPEPELVAEPGEAALEQPLDTSADRDDSKPEPAIDLEPETEPGAEPADDTAVKEAAPLEDLSEIALYDASDEVIEPGKS